MFPKQLTETKKLELSYHLKNLWKCIFRRFWYEYRLFFRSNCRENWSSDIICIFIKFGIRSNMYIPILSCQISIHPCKNSIIFNFKPIWTLDKLFRGSWTFDWHRSVWFLKYYFNIIQEASEHGSAIGNMKHRTESCLPKRLAVYFQHLLGYVVSEVTRH